MATYLTLNQNYIQTGLGTLTQIIPATVSSFNIPVVNIPFSVSCQVTVPSALATGDGAGSGQGLGSGRGGGLNGLNNGDLGLGHGGVGQGFGPSNGYQQPPAAGSNATTGPALSSTLSIVVKQNGTTVYTAPAFTPSQLSLQFTCPLLCNAADSITIVFASSGAPDEAFQAIKANVNVTQGA
jgi:hypothetical protein